MAKSSKKPLVTRENGFDEQKKEIKKKKKVSKKEPAKPAEMQSSIGRYMNKE